MDGDRDRDPHWNTGLNSLGPKEKQKEGECEQGRQDQREPSPDNRWRLRQKPTLEHWTEPPMSNEEQNEGEHEQGRQDREECIHPLIQGD